MIDSEWADVLLEWYKESDGITVELPSEVIIALIKHLSDNT